MLLNPLLIKTSPLVIKGLNAEDKKTSIEELYKLDALDDGAAIEDVGILFPKIEMKKEKNAENKKGKDENEGLLDIKDFAKVDIRVAEILKAENVEGSDKLLELEVNSGLDTRTIIAGLAHVYKPEELVGKKILLVANLKPAKIFNKKSNGMLLAAKLKKKDNPVLIEINENIPVGAKLS